MDTLRVGIVGCGLIARVHASILAAQPGTKIVGVADPDLQRARALARKLEAPPVYPDIQSLLSEEKLDVLHVLVPPRQHASVCLAGMERGCHVLVEKPLALTVPEARRLLEIAEERQVLLCPVHSKVFVGAVQRAMELVNDGVLGQVLSVEATYAYDVRRNPFLSADGAQYVHWSYDLPGGPLQDFFPHPASLLVELLPNFGRVQKIEVHHGALPGGWPDELRAMVESDGVTAYLSLSLNEAPDGMALTVRGTGGVAHADLFSDVLVVQRKSSLPRAVARASSGLSLARQYTRGTFGNLVRFATGKLDKSGGIAPLVSRFYAAIRAGTPAPVSSRAAVGVVELMNRTWPDYDGDSDSSEPGRRVHAVPHKVSPRGDADALVTGATGFIGTHLVKRLLAEGLKVRALVRPNSMRAGRLHGLDLEVAEGDLADEEAVRAAVRGVGTVFHAGSEMGGDWDTQRRVTVQGTAHVIEAALKAGVDRFVHFSSLAVYDVLNPAVKGAIREDCPQRPPDPARIGAYNAAKVRTERLISEAVERGLDATVIRPGIVIGPGGRLFFAHLGYRLDARAFFVIGDGENILPLTYVENLADAVRRASVSKSAIGNAYNVVDDGEVTVNEYLEAYRESRDTPVRILHLPFAAPYALAAGYELAAAVGLAKKGRTSRAQLQWKLEKMTYDNSRAKRELKWKPAVPIREGMRRTFAWHRERS